MILSFEFGAIFLLQLNSFLQCLELLSWGWPTGRRIKEEKKHICLIFGAKWMANAGAPTTLRWHASGPLQCNHSRNMHEGRLLEACSNGQGMLLLCPYFFIAKVCQRHVTEGWRWVTVQYRSRCRSHWVWRCSARRDRKTERYYSELRVINNGPLLIIIRGDMQAIEAQYLANPCSITLAQYQSSLEVELNTQDQNQSSLEL